MIPAVWEIGAISAVIGLAFLVYRFSRQLILDRDQLTKWRLQLENRVLNLEQRFPIVMSEMKDIKDILQEIRDHLVAQKIIPPRNK